MVLIPVAVMTSSRQPEKRDYPIHPVHFTEVEMKDAFWNHKIERNLNVTLPFVLGQLEDKGGLGGSSLYKVLEGISYYMMTDDSPQLESMANKLIQIVRESQQPDGDLLFPGAKPNRTPMPDSLRWLGEDFGETGGSHKLYFSGHMFEAAVAHYEATGKKDMLDMAEKNAQLLLSVFGPDKLVAYPFHPEIELALVKLYRATGKKEYLELSKFFIDSRGPDGTEYGVSNKKVTDQTEPIGHAVRALYLYSGVTDIVALTGDRGYARAIDTIWKSMVRSKIYITGGTGSYDYDEAFGKRYQLPNEIAYNETCASIADILWNDRMFRLKGDAAYIDVLERVLYNSLLDGVSISGDRFFYPNPLASNGEYQRASFYGVPCCLTNIVRFMPQIPGFIYAYKENDLYVNLFIGSSSKVDLKNGAVEISQETGYPWDGEIIIKVDPLKNRKFTVRVRIPGWAEKQPLPSGLYYYENEHKDNVKISLNGKPVKYYKENGYAVFERRWSAGDEIKLELPMDVMKIYADNNVVADRGRMALQRGPVVYCLEGQDNKEGHVQNIMIKPEASFSIEKEDNLLDGTYVLNTTGYSFREQQGNDKPIMNEQEVRAIPYYLWANRGPSEMIVWIPCKEWAIIPHRDPSPTIAATSKVLSSYDTVTIKSINDQRFVSNLQCNPVCGYYKWPLKDTTGWVQYVFNKPETVSSVKVYWYDRPFTMIIWYDDQPWTCCRPPESWELLYLNDNKEWQPVNNLDEYGTEERRYNEVRFEPVKTTSLKMVVKRQKKCACGLQEWVVE